MSRRLRATLASAIVAVLASACTPAAAPRSTVSMRMRGTPATATVTIDDRLVGTLEVVAARGVAVPPGEHHLSVEAPGYLPMDRVFEAKEGAPVLVEVALVRVPD